MLVLKGRVFTAATEAVIEDGVVVIEGNRILSVGSSSEVVIPTDAMVREYANETIIPGLIDAHVHLGLNSFDTLDYYNTSLPEKVCMTIQNCKKLVEAGFTTVREAGGISNQLKEPMKKHHFTAPRISSAGYIIAQTSGHFDSYQKYPMEMNRLSHLSVLADGVDECRKAARMQFRAGADFLKIGVTGGAISQGDQLTNTEYSDEEIRVIVEEAERHGTYVASHAHSMEGVRRALNNGITSIEHATFIDDEHIDLFLEKNATIVPTMALGKNLLAVEQALPEWFRVKVKQFGDEERGLNFYEVSAERHAKAYKRGVRYGIGTDFVGDQLTPYGNNAQEFEIFVKDLKMTPAQAIMAGTKVNSEILRMEDQIGTLEPGKCADLIVVKGNPLEDISLLTDVNNIKVVMIDGEVKKGTLE